MLAGLLMIGFFQGAFALPVFSIKPDSGVVLCWQKKTNAWVAVKDSMMVGIGDSIYLDDKYSAKMQLGKGASMLARGEFRMCIAGTDSQAILHVDQGSLFFKRAKDAELAAIVFSLRGCNFTPIGTAAGIKYTNQGDPTVAVLEGSVKCESAKGQSAMVGPGNSGTWEAASSSFKQAPLPPEVLAFLEKWSGAKLEQPQAQPDGPALSEPVTENKPALQSAQPIPTSGAMTVEEQKKNQPDGAKPLPEVKNAEMQKPTLETQKSTASSSSGAGVQSVPAEPKSNIDKAEKTAEASKPRQGNAAPGVRWEISAGSVTVGGKQWTRIAVSPDIPIGKFGVCLDLEVFIDPDGKISDKGWKFDNDNTLASIFRKIRYIRYGYENEPLFVKVGGLSNVSLGYGFVVDRFTNMLHYPDEKLLGLQFYLNNISPIGITLQTMVADFNDFKNDGGIVAGRLAVCPLKLTGIPLLSDLSVGATYGVDLNEYAPARTWDYSLNGGAWDRDNDGIIDSGFVRQLFRDAGTQLSRPGRDSLIAKGEYDTVIQNKDAWAQYATSRYAELGADIGLPLIKGGLLGLDVYGQAAVVADTVMFKANRTGWGFGLPGVALRIGPFSVRAEYRHIRGSFIPGYFGPYYYDERIQRDPVETKSQEIRLKYPASSTLDGIFGTMGFNIVNVVILDGTYQYLVGKNNAKDQRFEAGIGIGDALLKRVPKITKAELYFSKTDIGSTDMRKQGPAITYDGFFDETPSMYYGYRIGLGITQGASIILDTRYGYMWQGSQLVQNNNILLQTAVTF